jgi:cation diffusion facilitator CzcD-associated flavoprotein CzcO
MLEWLIVGGGVHGTYLSNYLFKVAGVDADKLLVVDPHDEALAVWKRCTENTCMKYLRSPSAHNLDIGQSALKRFGRDWSGLNFRDKYERPSLKLFNAHCDHVIENGSLKSLRVKAKAVALSSSHGAYTISTTSGEYQSQRVILAMGGADCLAFPDWASKLPAAAPIAHIFASTFELPANKTYDHVVVVGAGISGVQLATSLVKNGARKVTLVHSKPFTRRRFDADPCWLDDRCLSILRRKNDFGDRRRIVDAARHVGTFPEDVHQQLESALNTGSLKCLQQSVVDAEFDGECLRLFFEDGSDELAEFVVLATGFSRYSGVSGGEFIQSAASELGLKCAPCGSPITDEQLRWHDRLYVTGPLAELVVGPASRNIIGARMAAQRIGSSILRKHHTTKEQNYFYFQQKRR